MTTRITGALKRSTLELKSEYSLALFIFTSETRSALPSFQGILKSQKAVLP